MSAAGSKSSDEEATGLMTPVDREASDTEDGEDQFYDADGTNEVPPASSLHIALPAASDFGTLHAQLSPLAQSTPMLAQPMSLVVPSTMPSTTASSDIPAATQPNLPADRDLSAPSAVKVASPPSELPGSRTASPFKEGSTLDPLSHHIRHRRRQASVASLGALGTPGELFGDGDSTDDASSTQQSHATSAAMVLFAGLKRRAKHVMEGRDAVQGQDADERYIKIRTKKKPLKEFDRLSLVQEVSTWQKAEADAPAANAIWAMKFSTDGKFLATAGQDPAVTVWTVRSKVHRPLADNEIVDDIDRELLDSRPFRSFVGHQSTICDLAWSKSNFLLSSSMDRTVMLWHTSRNECLCVFQHTDYVTAIAFHPKDDRYFISGSLDCRIRMWSVAEKRVVNWLEIPHTNLITAVTFNTDGKTILAGTYTGACFIYTVEGLKFVTEIMVRSTKGRNARGSKITGIECIAGNNTSDEKMLITTNDSRIRLYSLRDFNLICKYKGAQNRNSQIRASFSEDGQYLLCGSEDKCVYIWNTDPSTVESLGRLQSQQNGDEKLSKTSSFGSAHHRKSKFRRDRSAMFESFHASGTIITVAIFAPQSTNDLFYDVLKEQAHIVKSGEPRDAVRLKKAASAAKLTEAVSALQRLIVCADHQGVIRVYENFEISEKSEADLATSLANKSNPLRPSPSIQKQSLEKTEGRISNPMAESRRSDTSDVTPHLSNALSSANTLKSDDTSSQHARALPVPPTMVVSSSSHPTSLSSLKMSEIRCCASPQMDRFVAERNAQWAIEACSACKKVHQWVNLKA